MKISEIVRKLSEFELTHGDIDIRNIHFANGYIIGYEIDPASILQEMQKRGAQRWPFIEEESEDDYEDYE